MGNRLTRSRMIHRAVLLSPLPVALASLLFGSVALSWREIPSTLANAMSATMHGQALVPQEAILWEIRLPRVLLALAVGGALGGSGAACQAVFRNPLVEPFILGISAGASLGAALAITVFPWVPVALAAFIGAVAAVTLACGLARSDLESSPLTLVLCGLAVSSLANALLGILKIMADPKRLSDLVAWLMGSLSLSSWKSLAIAAPGIGIGLAGLFAFRWPMNLLSLGEEEARSLGIDARSVRTWILAIASLATSSAVCASGIIGWVGLLIPHMARLLVGPDHRRSLTASIALGATFLVGSDALARALCEIELPVGAVTTLVGVPCFLALLKRGGQTWTR